MFRPQQRHRLRGLSLRKLHCKCAQISRIFFRACMTIPDHLDVDATRTAANVRMILMIARFLRASSALVQAHLKERMALCMSMV